MDQRPIGVFDSGLGGITAVRELKALMPHENIIYFGDTSRVPYGTKSREIIRRYATQDIRFLLSKQVKFIIAACGTVSSNPPEQTITSLPVPYTDVLHPTAHAACMATRNGKIGVIATPATIKSHAYRTLLHRIMPKAEIIEQPCPLFVPLVENGYTDRDNPITRMVAAEYLDHIRNAGADTLILGCTHYPIIADLIGDLMGNDVTLINSGAEAAKNAQSRLLEEDLMNNSDVPGSCRYFVSDDIEGFGQSASVFLEDDIAGQVEKVAIESY